MSYDVQDIVWEKSFGAKGHTKKMLFLALAATANKDGTSIFKSTQTFAWMTDMSRRQVQLTLNEWRQSGLIRAVGERPCENGHVVEYAIDLDQVRKLPNVRKPKTRRQFTGEQHAPVNAASVTGESSAPEPMNTIHPTLSLDSIPDSVRAEQVSIATELIDCEDFRAAWSLWPKLRRIKKGESFSRWRSAAGGTADKLVAVQRYLSTDEARKDKGKWVPAFPKWLDEHLESWLETSPASVTPGNAIAPNSEFEWWNATASQLIADDPAFWISWGPQCVPCEEDEKRFVLMDSPTGVEKMSRRLETMRSPVEVRRRITGGVNR